MGAAKKIETQDIISRLDDLPTLPTIVYELSRVINDPMSSINEVESIMRNDPSLTGRVLKLANSAYYAIPGGVSSLQRAIGYIGYDSINQLVLSCSVIKALDAGAKPFFEPVQFWRHSLGVAMAAEATAQFVQYKTPSDLFTCGLIHDLGKIALFIIAPELFEETIQLAKDKRLTIFEAELELGYPQHTVIGRELAQKWKLPTIIQASAQHHHQRDLSLRSGVSPELNQVVDIIFFSNLLVQAFQFGNSGHGKVLGVPKDILERLHIDPNQLKELIAKIKVSISSAEAFLKIIEG